MIFASASSRPQPTSAPPAEAERDRSRSRGRKTVARWRQAAPGSARQRQALGEGRDSRRGEIGRCGQLSAREKAIQPRAGTSGAAAPATSSPPMAAQPRTADLGPPCSGPGVLIAGADHRRYIYGHGGVIFEVWGSEL